MWPAASPRYSTADPVQISASVSLLEVAGRKRRPHAGLAISGFAFSSIVLTLTTATLIAHRPLASRSSATSTDAGPRVAQELPDGSSRRSWSPAVDRRDFREDLLLPLRR